MAFFSSTLNKAQKGNIKTLYLWKKHYLTSFFFYVLLQAIQIGPKMYVHLRVYCLHTSRKKSFLIPDKKKLPILEIIKVLIRLQKNSLLLFHIDLCLWNIRLMRILSNKKAECDF